MKFKLFSQVALREDIPKYGLKKGATATIEYKIFDRLPQSPFNAQVHGRC